MGAGEMRDFRQVYEVGKSEDRLFDKQRAERINLKTFSYGVPKFDLGQFQAMPGTCEKCVFGSGEHSAGCNRLEQR
jgi:hypothetical protein